MNKYQIAASIKALRPAPDGETLRRIAVRAAHWLLGTIADRHPAIAQTQALYARVVDDDGVHMPPSDAEWQANIDDLDPGLSRALALARALSPARARALVLARAIARTRARTRAIDLDLARASALDINLTAAILRLMGDRLQALPHLDRAVLAAVEAPGCSLNMEVWHSCETAHCRAGWAITLHPVGAEMEAAFGPWLAGAVIYLRSTGRVPNFLANTPDALADIRACAAAS